MLFWVKIFKFDMKEQQNNFTQAQNLAKIEQFFQSKTATMLFLALSLFFAILLVVFGQPVVVLSFTDQLSTIHPLIQLTLTIVAGLIVLTASRVLLLIFCNRFTFSPIGYLLWVMVELIGIIATLCTILWVVSGGGHLQLGPLAGDMLLGTIFVTAMPYTISFLIFLLQQEQHEKHMLQEELERLQPARPAADTPAGNGIINFHNRSNRLVFSIESQSVLYIEAADNYTNIHYLNDGHEETYILHNTLKVLEAALAGTTLMRCHRGYMVNLENVRRLQREGSSLQLELSGTTKVIPVTKTYTETIAGRLAALAEKQ